MGIEGNLLQLTGHGCRMGVEKIGQKKLPRSQSLVWVIFISSVRRGLPNLHTALLININAIAKSVKNVNQVKFNHRLMSCKVASRSRFVRREPGRMESTYHRQDGNVARWGLSALSEIQKN